MTTVAQPLTRALTDGTARSWLAVDAVVTGGCAVLYLAAAPVVVDLLGSSVGATRAIGGFLLGFAVVVAAVAMPRSTSAGASLVVAAVNGAWVVASVAVVATGALDLTPLGVVWALVQAAVVGGLAIQQLRSRRG